MKAGITKAGDAGIHFNEVMSSYRVYRPDILYLSTKAPHLLLDKEIPDNSILHICITGHGGTYLEPGVIPCDEAIEYYHSLVKIHGGEKVVLFVNPIVPTPDGILKAMSVIRYAKGRVSLGFLRAYPNLIPNWPELYSIRKEIYDNNSIAPIQLRSNILFEMEREFLRKFELCGESGMSCSGCVSERDGEAINIKIIPELSWRRLGCVCLLPKIELLSHPYPCTHNCRFCFHRCKSVQ